MAMYDATAIANLNRLYAAPQIVEQRRRFRALLKARPGETGLDVGAGAGHLSCELIREVGPTGRIAAIDSSADAVAATRMKADAEGCARSVTAQVGDATRLPFDDSSFDFVAVVQVYCYVADVAKALAEAHRVLRPGGRIAILDTDWDTCVLRSTDEELTHRLLTARMRRRFAHAHLPRRLPELLHAARLRLALTEVIPIVETSWDAESFGAGLLPSLRQEGREDGIAEQKLEAWEKAMRSRTGPGEWFFSLNRFAFVAHTGPSR
jgi:ubiquinone/menaquinone biosynthesis C-methylase UbiE